jgi:hypothetical protein
MTYHHEHSASESEDDAYYSAEDTGFDNDGPEDEEMDWEASRSTVSVPCGANSEESTSNLLLCANAASFMTGIQTARALKTLLATSTLYVC